MTQIRLHVNNQAINAISPKSIAELVALNQLGSEGTAIACNNTIISKQEWATTYLKDNDSLDVFTLVAGG